MPWFRVDDKFHEHPKAIKAGKDGRALWFRVGTACASFSTDGYIDGEIVAGWAMQAEVPRWKQAVRRLVDVALWHDHDTVAGCRACTDQIEIINADRRKAGERLLEVGAGDFFVHEWWKYQQPAKANRSDHAKRAEDRLRMLHKMTGLKDEIQRRDQDRCRYCGDRVSWTDRKSGRRGTYDHVNPFLFEPDGGNTLDGVVTACGTCNGQKGARTPEEWCADKRSPGRPLLPPPPAPSVPIPATDGGGSTSGSTSGGRSEVDPEVDRPGENLPPEVDFRPENLPLASRDARLGPGQIRGRSGVDPEVDPGRAGPGRAGQGLAGLVRGRAGPGLDGLGLVGFTSGRVPPPGGPVDRSPPDASAVDVHHRPPPDLDRPVPPSHLGDLP